MLKKERGGKQKGKYSHKLPQNDRGTVDSAVRILEASNTLKTEK